MDMGIDLTPLKDGAGLVQTTEVTSDSERVTMRNMADVKLANDMLLDEEIGCNEEKRTNVMTNMFRYKAQRQRYPQ